MVTEEMAKSGICHGGKPEDFKHLTIRRWPGPGKRRVNFGIETYMNMCPGAMHFFPGWELEANPRWDPKGPQGQGPGCWRTCWGEDDGSEKSPIVKFTSYSAAARWLTRQLKRFAGEGFELSDDGAHEATYAVIKAAIHHGD